MIIIAIFLLTIGIVFLIIGHIMYVERNEHTGLIFGDIAGALVGIAYVIFLYCQYG